jgi:hypothetical protein
MQPQTPVSLKTFSGIANWDHAHFSLFWIADCNIECLSIGEVAGLAGRLKRMGELSICC